MAIALVDEYSSDFGPDASASLSTGDRRIPDFNLFEKFHNHAKPTDKKSDIQIFLKHQILIWLLAKFLKSTYFFKSTLKSKKPLRKLRSGFFYDRLSRISG